MTRVGFKKFFVERFTPEYQNLYKEIKLVQMKHTGSLKACVLKFYAQMNATSKIDKYAEKCIFLDGVQMWVVDALLKIPKLLEDVAGIIKIAKSIEVDGPSQQNGLSQNMSRDK